MPENLYIDVILPVKVPNLYTYAVPEEWRTHVMAGKRVTVQFGKKKIFSALIRVVHNKKPEAYEAKEVITVLDDKPIVNEKQFEFWDWMAGYYACTRGEIMNAALPSSLKLESETRILFNKERDHHFEDLNDGELIVAQVLEKEHEMGIEEVQKLLDRKSAYRVIQSLIEKEVAFLKEDIEEEYKPKYESYLSLNAELQDEKKMQDAFEKLEKRAPKQVNALMAFLHLSNHHHQITKQLLQKEKGVDSSAITALVEKNILTEEKKEVSRIHLPAVQMSVQELSELNEDQLRIIDGIGKDFDEKEVSLLYGVTSSGKTHIYIKLIEEQLKKGKQVLYLLPEIALTTQIITRLRKVFGDKIGIYHSRFSNNERVEIWKNVLNGHYQVVLGARSAIFLPFDNLGLIIVDEEHDPSFKQFDPAPRYNARDSAIMLGQIHNGKVLLGTATPSIESYYNATNPEQKPKYGLQVIKKRFGGVLMPEIDLINLRDAMRRKKMNSLFTEQLLSEIQLALQHKEQVILFQNRRGFAPMLVCENCNWIPKCKNCDVSLTYHKFFNVLKCHYCGYQIKLPRVCAACGSSELKMQGFGTEKIEEELKIIFPDARIARMDLDAVKKKDGHHKVISDFEQRRIDVLVGTQMVTKGLDFDNVRLVGILNADMLLNYPDLRSSERAFQLMAQVSGRAGRKDKRGKVLIQTAKPNHPVLQYVLHNNFEGFFAEEIGLRKMYRYPPFYRLINILVKHKDAATAEEAAKYFISKIRDSISENLQGVSVIGPTSPVIGRIKNQYLKSIMVKLIKSSNVIHQVKAQIQTISEDLQKEKKFSSVQIVIDVDPY